MSKNAVRQGKSLTSVDCFFDADKGADVVLGQKLELRLSRTKPSKCSPDPEKQTALTSNDIKE